MKLKIRSCSIAERDHKEEQRAYCHWGHKPNTICISKSIYELPLNHSLALIAHEVGHALVGGGTEEQANWATKKYIGVSLIYLSDTPWGKRLQYIKSPSIRKVYKNLSAFVDLPSLKSFLPPQ